MCFHSALGYVQIASDFRIVAALQQQIDDLPLPLSHFHKLLFHALTSKGCARRTASGKSALKSDAQS